MPHLRICLLGPPEITLDDRPVATDRRKAIALLARLAVESKPLGREALAALLWPDYPRQSSFAYLRRTVWELNQMLGEGWIKAERDSVTLDRSQQPWIDVEVFQQAFSAGQAGAIEQAIGLVRGDFLQGLLIADTPTFEDWQSQQSEYFRRQYGQALEKLTAALEQSGSYERALLYARRWLALDPLDEAACRAVMRQMAGLGDRAATVRQYQAAVQALQSELGVAPQPETTALYQAILQGEASAAQPEPVRVAPAQRAAAPLPGLPTPPTPFIGRRPEVEQVFTLLHDPANRLVTLQGPGGAGKTRLSIQAASEIAPEFPDGAWFVPLAAVQSVQGMIVAAANALSISFFRENERPRQQLLDFLSGKRLLLVLDNLEHVLKDGTELVNDMLAAAPGVKLLVTSRVRLSLQAEQVFRVAGMRFPDRETAAAWEDPGEQSRPFSAVQLFLERAHRVQPGFQLTRLNQAVVADICRLVDGSPLGIELAAAWLELLPPEEIAAEIARSLDFLESSAPDMPSRQRSLRAVFETSWKLLEENEKQAFCRLSVFQGSFTRQAAQQVSGASLRTLLGLANKSWLQQTSSGRFQLHELLRQYGLERLQTEQGEWQGANDQHAAYFAALISEQGRLLRTAGQIAALETIKAELDGNIQAAWKWLVSSGKIDILVEQMLPGLFHYWMVRNINEDLIVLLKLARKAAPAGSRQRFILEIVETGFELSWSIFDDRPRERLESLWEETNQAEWPKDLGFWYFALVASYRDAMNYEVGDRRYQELLANLPADLDPWELGYSYIFDRAILDQSNLEIVHKSRLDSGLAIFQKLGVVHEQGIVLRILGALAAQQKNYPQAIEYSLAACSFFEQAGDIMGIASILINLADYYTYFGKIDQAFQTFDHLKGFVSKAGNRRFYGQILSWESLVHSRFGKLEDALAARQESLDISRMVRSQMDIAWHTWELGEVHRLLGDFDQARAAYQLALPTFESLDEYIGQGFYHRGLGDIAMMQGDWEEARRCFEQALFFHEKEQRSVRTWGLVYIHARLGTALVELGALDAARQHLFSSLRLAEERVNMDLKAPPLLGIAAMLARRGQVERAIEIAACISSSTVSWNESRTQARRLAEHAAQNLPPETARVAGERGASLEIEQLAKDIIKALEEGSI